MDSNTFDGLRVVLPPSGGPENEDGQTFGSILRYIQLGGV